MLTNKETGNKVYIDIDIILADFMASLTWQSIKARLPGVEDFIGCQVSGLRIRPSSSGNAHIEISFSQNISVLDNLCVRAWLNDDIWRLRLDLVRYLKTDNPARINRLWSGKWKVVDHKEEMRLCGEWSNIDLAFMPAAREAWFRKEAERLQKDLDREEREKEITRASEGMRDAIIPSAPPGKKDDDWPEMTEDLIPAPIHQWKPAQQSQTSQHQPGNSSTAPGGQSTLLP